MDILSRKEAKAADLKTYYTGELCKNGHVSYRYVQSGACSMCVNGAASLAREALTAENQIRREAAKAAEQVKIAAAVAQREQRRQLVEKYFICPDNRWAELSATIVLLTQCRFPALREVDIVPDKSRQGGIGTGNGRYKVNMYADDYAPCMLIEDQLNREKKQAYEKALFDATPGALKAEHIRTEILIEGTKWSGYDHNHSEFVEDVGVIWWINEKPYMQDDLTSVIEGYKKFAIPIDSR